MQIFIIIIIIIIITDVPDRNSTSPITNVKQFV